MAKRLKIEYMKIGDLKPNPKNPRKNDQAVDSIVRSMAEFDWTNPILCDKNNVIIAGHTRWKAAQAAGMKTVPVIHRNFTKAKAKAYMIADNKLSELAEWDDPLLAEAIQDLKESGIDVTLLGFDIDEINKLTGVNDYNEGLIDEDDAPEPPKKPKTKVGDVYQLGDHRLLCGDATSQDDMLKLMNAQKADMAWTDPPYNVNYTGNNGRKKSKERKKIANDNMATAAFNQFLHDSFRNMALGMSDGAVSYITHSESERDSFTQAFKNSGFHFAQALIWAKQCAVLCRQDFNWQHEPILYGWKKGKGHYFCGNFCLTSIIDDDTDIDKLKKDELLAIVKAIKEQMPSSIIRIDRPTVSVLHPTMKPIKLIQRCLEYSSKAGDIVLDPFGGSGSTLIACEKTRRTCYTMEMDPGYCDVIVQRWEEYTGKKAKRSKRAA